MRAGTCILASSALQFRFKYLHALLDEAVDTTILTLRLGSDIDEARAAIGTAVDWLVGEHRHEPRLVVTLTAPTLPAGVISALIAGLRRLREHGGTIELQAEQEGARQALLTTGLDRVFEPVTHSGVQAPPPDETPPRRTRFRGVRA